MVLRRFMEILGFKRQRGFSASQATAPLQLNLAEGGPRSNGRKRAVEVVKGRGVALVTRFGYCRGEAGNVTN